MLFKETLLLKCVDVMKWNVNCVSAPIFKLLNIDFRYYK